MWFRLSLWLIVNFKFKFYFEALDAMFKNIFSIKIMRLYFMINACG